MSTAAAAPNPPPVPTDFQSGADFISFAFSPSPPPEAGPSNPRKRPAPSVDLAAAKGSKPLTKKQKKREKKLAKQERRKARVAEKQEIPGDDPKGKKRRKESDLDSQDAAEQKGCPWATMVDWDECRDPAEMLNAEIDAFYRFISPTKQEFEVRLFLIELITRAINGIWPEAVVTPFGSWTTHLYLPHGDIDLVVAHPDFTESKKVRLLGEMARAVRNASLTDTVAIISKARVPIIKFVTTFGKLNVDVSLNQTNGISAGKIINQYLEVLPGCRQLILVVKAFLSQRSMNEVFTGGIGSYAVICMVISFLQIHPKLRRMELDPEENLGTLLIEFFELYGRNLNYDEIVLSVRRGGRYIAKRSKGWYRQNQPFLLSIEDPQDPDNDISGGSYGIRQVKATLSGAFEMLTAKLFERAEQLSTRGPHRQPFKAEEMSILGAVVSVRKEAKKHRLALLALHEERRLQKRLGIPVNVDAVDHFQRYSPPPLLRRGDDKRRGSPGKARRGKERVTHIIVDDDEMDEDSESEGESDFAEEEMEAFEREINPTPDLDQPNGVAALGKDRFASVSEDDFEIIDPPRPLEDGEIEESRYTATPKRAKLGARPRRSSSSSIEVIERLPPRPSHSPERRMTRAASRRLSESQPDGAALQIRGAAKTVKPPISHKINGKAKKDFWAAKGGHRMQDKDAFAEDQEYITLE